MQQYKKFIIMGQYILDYGNKGQRLLNALAKRWQSEEVDGVTKIEFAKSELKRVLREIVLEYEAEIAVNEARDNSINNNDFNLTIE